MFKRTITWESVVKDTTPAVIKWYDRIMEAFSRGEVCKFTRMRDDTLDTIMMQGLVDTNETWSEGVPSMTLVEIYPKSRLPDALQ